MDRIPTHRLRAWRGNGLEILPKYAHALFPIPVLNSWNEFGQTLPRDGRRFFNQDSNRQIRSSTLRAWRAFQRRTQPGRTRGSTIQTSYDGHGWSPLRFDAQRLRSTERIGRNDFGVRCCAWLCTECNNNSYRSDQHSNKGPLMRTIDCGPAAISQFPYWA